MLAVRKIRSYDEDFSPKDFSEEAQEIYIKAHEALAKFVSYHRLSSLGNINNTI